MDEELIHARRGMIYVPAYLLLADHEIAATIRALPGFKKATEEGMTFVASRAHVAAFRAAFPRLAITDSDGTLASLAQTIAPVSAHKRLGRSRGGNLWEHQHRGLDIIQSRNAYGEFFDMGTGKSAIVVQGACELHAAGKIDRALVIGTTRGKRAFLEDQVPLWLPDNAVLAAELYSSTSKRWARTFDDAPQGALRMLIVSPGCFQSKTQARAVYAWLREAKGRAAIFVDESQNFKGWSTQRVLHLKHFAEIAPYRYLFSGEPMPLGYIDLFAQFFVLDPRIIGHKNLYSFKNEYCVMGGFENRQIVSYRNLPRLVSAIAPHCEFLSIDACLDMPERNWQVMKCEPTIEQKRIYDQLEEDFIILAGEGEVDRSAINAASKFTLMAQVSNGFYYKHVEEETEVVEITDERARFTLEEAVGDADKCVIWCRFHADMDLLERVATEMEISWVEISGRASTAQGEDARKRFTHDPATRLLIGTTEAGGESLNLQVAHRMVYFSNSYNFGKREQSERRIWRAGQQSACWYIDVECFPIDRVIRNNLKNKRDMSAMLKTAVGRAALAEELRQR